VTDNIDTSSIGSINSAVNKFTECINSIATLFFSKVLKQTMLMSLVIVFKKNADWFDFECVDAKRRYFDAQRLFKQDNSRLNRHNILECNIF